MKEEFITFDDLPRCKFSRFVRGMRTERGEIRGMRDSLTDSPRASTLLVAALSVALSAVQPQPSLAAETKTPRQRGESEDPKRWSKTDPEVLAQEGPTEPSLQPQGVELGNFLLFPKLELDEVYDSNVFAEEDSPSGDFVTTLRPAVRLQSRLPRHALNLLATADVVRYARFGSDDHENLEFTSDGRLDIGSASEVTGLFSAQRYFEDRGSDDDQDGKEPAEVHELLGGVGGKTRFNRLMFSTRAEATRQTFGDVEREDGTRLNNNDRDRWEYEGSVTGGYEMFPGYAAQVAFTGNVREYDTSRDDLGFDRDSTGYRVDAGVGVDVTDLIRGDFMAGYLSQTYDDPQLDTVDGWSVRALFTWSPTRTTLVVPSLERSVVETTVSDASAILRSAAALSIRHEFTRDWIGYGYASYFKDEYAGTEHEADNAEFRVRLMHAFTDRLYGGLQGAYRVKDSTIEDGSFDRFEIGLRLGVQM